MRKEVKGYENLYEVNENGIIRSIPHLRKNGVNGSYINKGRIMKQRINPSGLCQELRLWSECTPRNEIRKFIEEKGQ